MSGDGGWGAYEAVSLEQRFDSASARTRPSLTRPSSTFRSVERPESCCDVPTGPGHVVGEQCQNSNLALRVRTATRTGRVLCTSGEGSGDGGSSVARTRSSPIIFVQRNSTQKRRAVDRHTPRFKVVNRFIRMLISWLYRIGALDSMIRGSGSTSTTRGAGALDHVARTNTCFHQVDDQFGNPSIVW